MTSGLVVLSAAVVNFVVVSVFVVVVLEVVTSDKASVVTSDDASAVVTSVVVTELDEPSDLLPQAARLIEQVSAASTHNNFFIVITPYITLFWTTFWLVNIAAFDFITDIVQRVFKLVFVFF